MKDKMMTQKLNTSRMFQVVLKENTTQEAQLSKINATSQFYKFANMHLIISPLGVQQLLIYHLR